MRCPQCGASQEESAWVLSTVCRQCGHYIKNEPAPLRGAGGFRFADLFKWRRPAETGFLKPRLGLSDEPRPKPAYRDSSRVEPFYGDQEYEPEPVTEEEGDDFSLSATGMGSSGEVFDSGQDGGEDLDDEEELGRGYEMVEVEPLRMLGDGGPSPMRRSLLPSYPERTTRCYDCGAMLPVSEKAATLTCTRCSVNISLEKKEIRDHCREPVKMRGNLTIHRNASLAAAEIACETLRVYGKITGRIDCHGDAFFRSSGKLVGNVHCRHLFVHKASDLTFVPGIRAETAEIHGRVVGDLICEGTIRISKTGVVLGDCIAPAIELESGGVLSGQMRIAKPDTKLKETYEQRAEVARSEFLMRGIEEFEESARQEEEEPDGEEDGAETGLSGPE